MFSLAFAATESVTPSESSSSSLDSLSIMLKPQLQSGPLPPWIIHPLNFSPESSSLEISLAPLSQQTSIDHFVLTVVFDDQGDGGPRIEWRKKNGEETMLCSGLGVNGPAVGLNARTLLIPYDLAFDGGKVVIHHEGRFNQVISATIQAAHTATIAFLGEENEAALLDQIGNIVSKDLAAGNSPPLKEGDVMKGRLMTAELSATTQQGNEFEFPFKLEGAIPETTMFNTEVIGLDLETQIEVRVNDNFVGMLNTAPFSLTSTELINTAGWSRSEDQPSFRLAGWRKAWLYIPARLWKQGEENHIVLSVPTTSSSGLLAEHAPGNKKEGFDGALTSVYGNTRATSTDATKLVAPAVELSKKSIISLRNTTLDLHYDNTVSLGHSTTPLAKDLFRY